MNNKDKESKSMLQILNEHNKGSGLGNNIRFSIQDKVAENFLIPSKRESENGVKLARTRRKLGIDTQIAADYRNGNESTYINMVRNTTNKTTDISVVRIMSDYENNIFFMVEGYDNKTKVIITPDNIKLLLAANFEYDTEYKESRYFGDLDIDEEKFLAFIEERSIKSAFYDNVQAGNKDATRQHRYFEALQQKREATNQNTQEVKIPEGDAVIVYYEKDERGFGNNPRGGNQALRVNDIMDYDYRKQVLEEFNPISVKSTYLHAKNPSKNKRFGEEDIEYETYIYEDKKGNYIFVSEPYSGKKYTIIFVASKEEIKQENKDEDFSAIINKKLSMSRSEKAEDPSILLLSHTTTEIFEAKMKHIITGEIEEKYLNYAVISKKIEEMRETIEEIGE